MKIFTVTLLVCAVTALNAAAVPPKPEALNEPAPVMQEVLSPEAEALHEPEPVMQQVVPPEAEAVNEPEPVMQDVLPPEAEALNEPEPVMQEVDSAVVKSWPSCPTGWTGYRGRCFRFFRGSTIWAQAEKNCQLLGGNLASVHSADEYHKIQRIILTSSGSLMPTWLGGSDAQQEGYWFWSDGSPFDYRHCGGFNNYQGRQHCLQMNYGAGKCWDDVWCDVHLPFVCARKMG